MVVGVSTNDGLGASWENMARLYQRKHYYFVPYGQDDPTNKPNSLKADFARLPLHWTLRWPGGSCSRCCWEITTRECLFSRGKVWYTII